MSRTLRRNGWLYPLGALLFAACGAFSTSSSAATAGVGDVYVYRVTNGYSKEPRGTITYRVEKTDSNSIAFAVTPDAPSLGLAHTEIYLPNGNWLRHPVNSHDRPVEYQFNPAYPAYQFPLDAGKHWSERVAATNQATGRLMSVRVDSEVLGTERIRVPAGEFDTIKVRREVYPGDYDGFLLETQIMETDWYAPALGRPVRSESRSSWFDRSRARNRTFYGDWNISELVEVSTAKR